MLFSSIGTANGVSENACPIRAAHRAGEVILEKSPRALMMLKYVWKLPFASKKGEENYYERATLAKVLPSHKLIALAHTECDLREEWDHPRKE
jgi:hypothetical protein